MNFEKALGDVVAVSTSQLTIKVTEFEQAESVEVGWLCGVRHDASNSWLIAIIDRIRRPLPGEDNSHDSVATMELTIIGQYVVDSKQCYFKRGSDAYPRLGSECFHLSGGNLVRLLNSVNASVDATERLELGTFALNSSARAILSGTRFFQRHAAVLGSTGSGKSWAVALLLERASKLSGANIVLFDLHGEYGPLSDQELGSCQRLRIAGPGDVGTRGEPGDDVLFLPYWLLSRDELFAVIADIRTETAHNQASRFARHILDLKYEWRDENDLSDELSSLTLDSPIPFSIDELSERLELDNRGMVPGARGEKKGPWNGLLTKVLERLIDKVADRRNGFMFQPPDESYEPEWLGEFAARLLCAGDQQGGIKIIDFSEVPSDLLPIVVSTLARLMYQIQFWTDADQRMPFCLICDEAHLYLPRLEQADSQQTRALEAFERIAKEGRKYGVSLLVVSQRPSDVSTTILSQCSNMLALRLTNQQDQLVVRRLLPDGMQSLSNILPILNTGEAMLIGDAVVLPTRIRLDVPNVKPTSATRDFWFEWSHNSNSPEVISTAVNNLRRQSRG